MYQGVSGVSKRIQYIKEYYGLCIECIKEYHGSLSVSRSKSFQEVSNIYQVYQLCQRILGVSGISNVY